jgi:hypothetical protein
MRLTRVTSRRPSVLLLLLVILALVLTWSVTPLSRAVAAEDAAADQDGATTSSLGQCRSGLVCVWSSASFGGTFASTGSHAWDATNITTARSLRNQSSYAARLFSESDGTGSWTCIPPGALRSSTSVPAASMRLLVTTSC